jgi:hypothetical protein
MCTLKAFALEDLNGSSSTVTYFKTNSYNPYIFTYMDKWICIYIYTFIDLHFIGSHSIIVICLCIFSHQKDNLLKVRIWWNSPSYDCSLTVSLAICNCLLKEQMNEWMDCYIFMETQSLFVAVKVWSYLSLLHTFGSVKYYTAEIMVQ